MNRNNRPWSFGEARQACRDASKAQLAAEGALRDAARDLAAAEEQYRLLLARKIVELHDAGVAWSVCDDVARGDPAVASARHKRDVLQGVYAAMEHAAWRRNADRKDSQRFSDWSMRRELAESAPGSEQPEWSRA